MDKEALELFRTLEHIKNRGEEVAKKVETTRIENALEELKNLVPLYGLLPVLEAAELFTQEHNKVVDK